MQSTVSWHMFAMRPSETTRNPAKVFLAGLLIRFLLVAVKPIVFGVGGAPSGTGCYLLTVDFGVYSGCRLARRLDEPLSGGGKVLILDRIRQRRRSGPVGSKNASHRSPLLP